ncbi:MAG TPA: PDZ domain-containing protein [Tepidisphaeraceae bacterium]|jgi:hypothetical protein|nr:PDZ domain-containing protein [Tepidisphaeraceae bacterium]
MRSAVALILAICCTSPAMAEQPPTNGQSNSIAFLQQLNHEVRAAYTRASNGIVRVHLPTELVNPAVDVIRKWEPRLNPELRRNAGGGAAPATAPATNESKATAADGAATRPMGVLNAHANVVTVGLVLDTVGTLLVPAYLDPARVGKPIAISTKDGVTTEATVVAADRATGITLLRMREPLGQPVTLAKRRPDAGMLLISLCGDETRLTVWTGASRESAVLILPNQEIAVLRGGRFMGGAGYASLVQQLLKDGTVQRASLGLRVAELPPYEQGRLARVEAIDRPGLFVGAVTPDQAGAAAGVQVGDLLLEIGGHTVPDVATVAAVLAEVRGQTTLTLGREGKRIQIDVELGQPQPAK